MDLLKVFWVSWAQLCAYKYRTTEFSFPQIKPTRKWEHLFVILVKTCNEWQWIRRQMCVVPNRTSLYHIYTKKPGRKEYCRGVISGIQISWVFILRCNISVFTCRRMSRASGWSTLRGVYWPMTAHFSRCSTTILFKAEKLPGKHSSPWRSIVLHNIAHWKFQLRKKHFSLTVNPPLPQVGSGRTFQVQIQSAG